MSVIQTTTVDCAHNRNHSSKRKFDDYGPIFDEDDDYAADLLVRMKKDKPEAVNSSSDVAVMSTTVSVRASDARSVSSRACAALHSQSTRYESRLQFFVRMISKTVVMHAFPQDSVKSIHERIELMTGIPIVEQRLIYRGKQLRWEQTLYECAIENDTNIQMVCRMKSTRHPQGWKLVDEMVSIIWRLCRRETVHDSLKIIKGLMTSYLSLAQSIVVNEYFSSYFDIFLSSNAPMVLVMLYFSPCPGNKELADWSIRHFLSLCKTIMDKSFHGQCARLVLELCKVLKTVGRDNPLYVLSRSTFASLLETATVSYCSLDDGCVLLQDILPFVRELADTLMRDLDLSIVLDTGVGPLMSDMRDFTAFLIPMRRVIKELQTLNGSNGIEELQIPKFSLSDDGKLHEDLLHAAEGADSLHLIFIHLLGKMVECLRSMEECVANKELEAGDFVYSAWSQYLSILKELYLISKLYDGAEEFFWTVLMQERRMVSLLIVKSAKRTDDHHWIFEHKAVTNFESRRHLALLLFPDVKEDYEELHEMLIDRSHLFTESFNYIKYAEPESLHAGLFMEFKNEEATGPGVLREWFFLVCQAIFNPQNALFLACPNDRRRFFPNPASKVHPLHLQYFEFSGRVIALALMHRVHVGIVFAHVFFVQLAGKSITLEDIKDADPCLYSSCKKILEMDADFIDSDALGLTFVREVEELGYRKVIELCPGGESLVVNSKNRKKYFFFQSLELKDLDWMLYGSDKTISVEDWKAHTKYSDYKESDHQISWFWEIVGRMSAEQRKVLLFFWTSVKHLPVEGFRGLASRLYIYKSLEPDDHLPSSHTCFYRLCFPAYSSKAIMQDRLGIITQEHIGCSFGTW
ncbi:putative aminoacyltransferase, E1 ubiquitin-activating enzyme [Lupinus albus]|uniref:HECT-type E3 ubiquitin transferase n=1 Tax=Lupinus albus TaxID=3870 RepID=A0A6A4NZG7_LUPAL|nr:putative aminoacyltransferase, E1 ubiquitin-activating enzyme [Lupinus albus]